MSALCDACSEASRWYCALWARETGAKARRVGVIEFINSSFLFFFVIEVAVAKAFKVGICDLGAELGTHALVLRGALQAAGAIAAGHGKTLANACHDLAIGVFLDLHGMFTVLS